MTVAVVLAGLGLLVVLIAFYSDMAEDRPHTRSPAWDLLPAPSDVSRIEFPLAAVGYDPASVEMHLDALARAYGDLFEAAPDAVRRDARDRAAHRLGVAEVESADVQHAPMATALGGPRAGTDADALRTEAALADLDYAHRERVVDTVLGTAPPAPEPTADQDGVPAGGGPMEEGPPAEAQTPAAPAPAKRKRAARPAAKSTRAKPQKRVPKPKPAGEDDKRE